MLDQYENLNADLPPNTRRQLALFVLAPKVGTKALEALFERPFGGTLGHHRSWMWYTAMRLSGLGGLWSKFASKHNNGVSLRDCLLWLRSEASESEWALLSKRLGIPIFNKGQNVLNPYWWKDTPAPTKYWTKGGTWDRRSPLTKIIVLGEHIERDEPINAWAERLTDADLRLLEREVHNFVDEDQLLYPDAVKEATEYVRQRIPQILGYKTPRASYNTASWFFQKPVPHHWGGSADWRTSQNYPTTKGYEWFPSKRNSDQS